LPATTPAARTTRIEFRKRVGVVAENLALLPELTIDVHLRLTGLIYGLGRATSRARAEDLLTALALAEKRHTYARECSYGMRKKAALALGLLRNPPVLMLDEPFEGVDPASVEVIDQLLRSASRRGVTILLTSHILWLVDRISDRIVLMPSGRILWNSPLGEIQYVGIEQLFRILRNARSADRLNPLGSVATQSGYVAAVENTAPSPGSSVRTRGTSAAGEQHCR
jgi:ABC-type multidrug transport system ATPase subunit